ncbi:hypothetical protein PIB30_102143 [Stylosanthes scabra]|uniref:Putative plant transposon protein domain-containing protein n=1 Tax=Stylosanthes scabra TaxID=79078 RepID=A0ABU6XX92_9FABA|nr:hypothetical protein [Stylosanthes scabra]
MADRKRKGKAESSSSQVPRFKTLFHEAHYKAKLSARKVLPELIIQVDENILDPCGFQIQQRKWERFTKPIQAVGHLMVKEFYANAWEPDKEKRKPYTYTTMKANKDYRLEHVLEDLCIEGADWVRHKDGRPHYLRRADLEPMTKGWYEFICRSFLPTTNLSELTVKRAVLIHSIIIGENINVEEIIADQIYKFVYKTDVSSSLPFPSIIAALCADAKIPAIKEDTLIPQELLTMGVAMTRTRETRARNPRRLDQQQEETRKIFETINTRMDHMDDQISFLCYSNQMANEQMLFPYQNTSRQFKEMEMQGIPVTMANLAIHMQKEEEINQERMRYEQILQEAAAQQAREANKGKAREVVPDSEEKEDSEELASGASKEW